MRNHPKAESMAERKINVGISESISEQIDQATVTIEQQTGFKPTKTQLVEKALKKFLDEISATSEKKAVAQ